MLLREFFLMIVRHGLTAAGLGGVLSGGELDQIVGAVGVLIGLLWSAGRKIRRARSLQ